MNALLMLLLICASPPTPELPAEVAGLPGEFVVVPAKTPGVVQWYSPDGLSMIPTDLLRDSRSAVVMSGRPGRYRLVAWTAAGDAPSPPAVCWVVIGVPPAPTPPAPPIDEPLMESLKKNPGSPAERGELLLSFRGSIEYWDRAEFTAGQMYDAIAKKFRLDRAKIQPFRDKVSDLLSGLPTNPDSPLTPEHRNQGKSVFKRAIAVLESMP